MSWRGPTPLSDTDLRPGRQSMPEPHGSGPESETPPLAPGCTDNALGILSSCGLEPADLALLAQLPEDQLTVDSLPHLVHQIRSRKETLKPPPAFSPLCDSPKAPVRQNPDPGWLVQYPLSHLASKTLPDWRDQWQNSGSPQSESSRFSRDTVSASFERNDRPRRAAANIPSLGTVSRRHASPSESRRTSGSELGHSETSAGLVCGWSATPSEQEVRDFHGAEPQTYPASCSLCNGVFISAENWAEHVSGSQHADGQLRLLQRFPTWNCRTEMNDRPNRQSNKKSHHRQTRWSSPASTENGRRSRNDKSAEKVAEKSQLVRVKFPPQSVDESYMRKLAEPFGSVNRILVFPSLAFVELDSPEQAQELVDFHKKRPLNVNGQQIDFSISESCNFAKSSRVVSFIPPPQSNTDKSDLLNVVKRFGPPVYTLFQRFKACVEMKSLEDAEKLVDYYSSNILRLNDKVLRVSFATDTPTLGTVVLAQRYQEDSIKRTRSRDEDHTRKESKKRRGEDHRSRSRETRSRDRKARSKSRDRKTRSNNPEDKTRSKSQEQTSSSRTKKPEAETAASSCGSAPAHPTASKPDAVNQDQSNVVANSSEDDSDIEGMAVLGEDDLESLEETGNDEELEKHSPEPATGEENEDDGKRDEKNSHSQADKSDEEINLEDCITLDEVGQEQNPTDEEAARSSNDSTEERAPKTPDVEDSVKLTRDKTPRSRESSDIKSGKIPEIRSEGSNTAVTRSEGGKDLEIKSEIGKTLENPSEGGNNHNLDRKTAETKSVGRKDLDMKTLETPSEGGNHPNLDRNTAVTKSEGSSTAETKSEGSKDLYIKTPETPLEGCNNHNLDRKTLDSQKFQSEIRKNINTQEISESEDASREDPGARPEDLNQSLRRNASSEDVSLSGMVQTQEPRSQRSHESQEANETSSGTAPQPVGTEFVRPVVGYFCSLCQLIYADEDEAKVRHCSSPGHWFKYQEKMNART
ncbi:matrin 3-like 1.1 [Corythoichthys intestinalis]|uniref:matrin 3-like 1.1 n=1 Tax=Corythoichthys intestinalis TaxID=161448 RepID=UPI0025A5C619|nr:matrin 3-like 1.1 [Corythoichthys intestinalis]